MSRRTNTPVARVNVRIPLETQARVELICADPLSGRSRYGRLSHFYTAALEHYISLIDDGQVIPQLENSDD